MKIMHAIIFSVKKLFFLFLIFFFVFLFCVASDASGFSEASKRANLVPLYRCIFSDHLTPVVAYRCLVQEDDREAPSFLFESVEPGVRVSNVVSDSFFCLSIWVVMIYAFFFQL